MNRNRVWFFVIIAVALLVVVLALAARGISSVINQNSPTINKPANAVEVQLIYAPEEELYITQAITDFNRSMSRGTNPLTGKELARNEKPVWITGKSASSGTAAQGVINAVIAPNNSNVERPVIFSPSVRHWLALVNFKPDSPFSMWRARLPQPMRLW